MRYLSDVPAGVLTGGPWLLLVITALLRRQGIRKRQGRNLRLSHLARVFISGSDTVTGLTASGSRQWLPSAGRATTSPRPSSWPRP
jgi:hypothetical protein